MSIPNAYRKARLPREAAFQREIKKPSRVGHGYASYIGYISITSGGCFCFYSEILIVFRWRPGEILGGKKRFAAVKAVKLRGAQPHGVFNVRVRHGSREKVGGIRRREHKVLMNRTQKTFGVKRLKSENRLLREIFRDGKVIPNIIFLNEMTV